MPLRQKKFQKGNTLTSIIDVVQHLEAGEYLFIWKRPVHPGWLRSMQFNTLAHLARSGAFSVALPNAEYRQNSPSPILKRISP